MSRLAALLTLASIALSAAASPALEERASFTLQNGKDAQALNAQFQTLTAASPCSGSENACIHGAFAQCVNGKFVTLPCSGGLTCVALPLVNSPGTRQVLVDMPLRLPSLTNLLTPA